MGDANNGDSKLNALVTQADENGQQQLADVVPEDCTLLDDRPSGAFASLCRCLRPSRKNTVKGPDISGEQPESARTPAVSSTLVSVQPCKEDKDAAQLGPQTGRNIGRKTLVLDIDETLVHSSFRPINNADIVITVEIEGELHHVYVRKRPGVDEFIERLADLYELVVYTASMALYANPLMDKLDKKGLVVFRLFREACTRMPGGYVKDLSKLGRDLGKVCIIDNSPICYSLQPDNAIPIQTWLEDPFDRELYDLIPILVALAGVDDIPAVLQPLHNDEWDIEDE